MIVILANTMVWERVHYIVNSGVWWCIVGMMDDNGDNGTPSLPLMTIFGWDQPQDPQKLSDTVYPCFGQRK